MERYRKGAVILVIVSFILMTLVFLTIVVAIRGQSIAQFLSGGGTGCTAEAAMKKGAEALKNTATFKYDGVADSLKLQKIEAAGGSNSWIVVYSFQSGHPGYGNRKGQILAQVITDHTVELNLKDCKVLSATCDNEWDLLTDKPLH